MEEPRQLGIVLVWKERPGFGRYGYLVPHQREGGGRLPIPFTQGNLINPDEPVEEGCVVYYEVQEEDEPYEREAAVNIEVERFTRHNARLDFNQADLLSFPFLKPEDPLSNHLLKDLAPELKKSLERYYGIQQAFSTLGSGEQLQETLSSLQAYSPEDWDQIPSKLMNFVNSVIAGPSLFKEERFAKVKFRPLTASLLKKNPQGHAVTWLNRLLLEDAYPKSFVQRPQEVDWTPDPYEATVIACDPITKIGHLNLKKKDDLIPNEIGTQREHKKKSWPFDFHSFPAPDVVIHPGDNVVCRIIYRSAYDIWPSPNSKEAQNVTERLGVVTDAAVQKIKTVILETRAAAEELKEAATPFREMYKDERLSKAKSEALKAGIPEVVVDAIVREYNLSKFPSGRGLYKRLLETGTCRQLERDGYGSSLQTVSRWHGTFRKIMVRFGLVDEFRSRSNRKQGKGRSSAFSAMNTAALASFAQKLFNKLDPVSQFLSDKLGDEFHLALEEYCSTKENAEELQQLIVEGLGHIIAGPPLLALAPFSNTKLRPETIECQKSKDIPLIELNLMVLQDAFPLELQRKVPCQNLRRLA